METRATIRAYQAEDLSRVLQLWQWTDSLPVGPDGLTVDQAVELIVSDSTVTLVAEAEGELVGMVVGSAVAAVGWIHRLTVLPEGPAGEQVANELVGALETSFAEVGVRRIATAVGEDDPLRGHLERRGYDPTGGVLHLERRLPDTVAVPSGLAELGGRMIHPGLWRELKGLEDAKQVIERRVILPLAEPELAARHAVAPPRAIVLFGPPGTGKTTFAKGIASRLAWPFVEIQPAELTGEGPDREASLLAQSFDRILGLSAAVVFVDEVEDVAAARSTDRKASPSVTNEFLKQIPRMRERVEHLLVCATNWVGTLDPAFLRPGRFDYVLPVGPPDREARAAIWRRYVEEITDEEVDVPLLVEASDLYTPADIEFAARHAAQRAFEREHFEEIQGRATTDDFLAAIRATRPTLSTEIVEGFRRDTERFARY